jgi:hypothetical protein
MLKIMLLLSFFVNSTRDGLVLDRSNNRNVVSVAATGFGYYAWALSSQYNIVSRQMAINRINQSFDKIMSFNKRNHGWLYHFTDTKGNPVFNKEVSTIDTGIFYACLELSAKILKDDNLTNKIKREKSKIDIGFMMNKSGYFCHGFVWDRGRVKRFDSEWDDLNEGLILYRLFDLPYKPKHTDYSLPLFAYYYPLCFYRDKMMIDNLGKAMDYQKTNAGIIGLTACDDPKTGLYSTTKLDVISPLSLLSCSMFFPAKCVFMSSPLIPSITRDGKHISRNRVLIDDGCCLILITQKNITYR